MATIQGVYVALFGRPADPTGLAFFDAATNGGKNLTAIGNLASTAEYQARFTGMNNIQIINSIYQSLFGRDADVTGLTFFANQLSSGRQTINTIAINILDGATGADLTTVNNKIAAADLYTKALDTGSEIVAYSGTAAADAGRAFLAAVTTTVPTAAAVDTSVAAMVTGAPANGQSFVLTKNVDNFTGGANNDVFTADQSVEATLSAADTINGGTGNDTLKVFLGTGVAKVSAVSLTGVTNVENVTITNGTLTATESLDVSTVSGLTTLTLDSQTAMADGANFTVKGSTTQALALTKVIGTANNATSTLTVDGFSGVALNGVGTDLTVDIKSTGTALNLSSTGAASTITLTNTGAKLTTLNVTGDKDVAVTESLADVKTIDASKATGGVTIDSSGLGANNDITFTGGAGNDVFVTTFANLTKDDKINLGAGTDTVSFSAAADLTTAANAEKLSGVTNVEGIKVTAGAFSVDGDLVAPSIFTVATTTAFTGTNLANTDKVVVDGITAAASTVAMKLGQNTFNLDLAGGKAAAAVAANGYTVTGASTVNVASTGTAGIAANQLKLTTDANGTVKLSGSQDLTLTTAVNSGTTGLSIDGSAATGKLDVTGTANADNIVGGSAADKLTGDVLVAEVQTVQVTGTANGAVTFLGRAVATSANNDTAEQTIDKIVADKTAVIAAWNGANAGKEIADITKSAADTLTVTYVNTKGDVAIIATATSANTTFANSVETTKGVGPSADTLTGNGGADKFVVVTNGAATANVADTITDYVTKTDKIIFSSLATAGTDANYKEGTTAVTDFAAAKAAADALFNGNTTVLYSAQQVGSDTYVFSAAAASNAAEHVVKLVGVSLAGIEFGDIAAS